MASSVIISAVDGAKSRSLENDFMVEKSCGPYLDLTPHHGTVTFLPLQRQTSVISLLNLKYSIQLHNVGLQHLLIHHVCRCYLISALHPIAARRQEEGQRPRIMPPWGLGGSRCAINIQARAHRCLPSLNFFKISSISKHKRWQQHPPPLQRLVSP